MPFGVRISCTIYIVKCAHMWLLIMQIQVHMVNKKIHFKIHFMYTVVNQYYFPIASAIIDKILGYTFKLCNKSFKLNCNKYLLRPTVNKLFFKILSYSTS